MAPAVSSIPLAAAGTLRPVDPQVRSRGEARWERTDLRAAQVEHAEPRQVGCMRAAMADLLKQESVPATERRLKRYVTPDLLVLDEIGYLPCETRAADLLYTIVSRRHERRSTVVSTNLGYKQWPTIFPSAACVGALVDRFAQHCHTLDIDADSWRKKGERASAR